MTQSGSPQPVTLRAVVFVDGLNLYFGCLKDSPHRWLDPATLCRLALPADCRLSHIHYFTAPLSPTPRDPNAAQNHETYLRALATLPALTLHRSSCSEVVRRRPLAAPEPGRPTYVTVLERQERGTDVKLATALLEQAHLDAFDVAVVVSDDSDLAAPILSARQKFDKPVQVLSPRGRGHALAQAATFFEPIDPAFLPAAQFPPTLADHQGPIHRPADW